jgi:acyl-CoA thioesterase FadM
VPLPPGLNADSPELFGMFTYELSAWVEEVGATSATLGFEVRGDGTTCVTARMTHVHLDVDTHRPAPLPDAVTAAARSRR